VGATFARDHKNTIYSVDWAPTAADAAAATAAARRSAGAGGGGGAGRNMEEGGGGMGGPYPATAPGDDELRVLYEGEDGDSAAFGIDVEVIEEKRKLRASAFEIWRGWICCAAVENRSPRLRPPGWCRCPSLAARRTQNALSVCNFSGSFCLPHSSLSAHNFIPYFCGSITGMSSNDPRRCWAHRSCSLFCDVFVVSPGKAQNAHAGKQTCLRVGKCPCFQCRTRMLHAVLSKFRSRKAHAGDANCVRWSPSGGGVLATGGDGEMVRVWCYAPPACCRRCSVLWHLRQHRVCWFSPALAVHVQPVTRSFQLGTDGCTLRKSTSVEVLSVLGGMSCCGRQKRRGEVEGVVCRRMHRRRCTRSFSYAVVLPLWPTPASSRDYLLLSSRSGELCLSEPLTVSDGDSFFEILSALWVSNTFFFSCAPPCSASG